MIELTKEAASPQYRAWRQLVRSLNYVPDPDEVLEDLAPNDFIICGCPRSGTSLAAAQLIDEPNIFTVMEPWDGLRMPPAELFRSLRAELVGGRLRRGRLDLDALRDRDQVRWISESAADAAVRVTPDVALGVKWPTFWQYLGRMPNTKFVVCVRDPREVVASLASQNGRLGQGLEYEAALNRDVNEALSRVADQADRYVAMYDLANERVVAHAAQANVFVLRYERWFVDPDGLVDSLSQFLGIALDSARLKARLRPAPRRQSLSVGFSRTAASLGYSL